MKKLFASLLVTVSLFAAENDQLPAERRVVWTPGVTVGVYGGIPTTRTNIINVTSAPYSADNTGVSDASTAINAAITAAVAGDIVYLPAGSYKIDSTIFVSHTKDNITIRGAGAANTTIVTSSTLSNQRAIMVGTDVSFTWPLSDNTVTAGLGKGNTSVTVVDASVGQEIDIGEMIRFSANRNMSIPIMHPYGYHQNNNDPWQQVVYIENINRATGLITFRPALYGDYEDADYFQYRRYDVQLEGVGIEDLAIDNNGTGCVSTPLLHIASNLNGWTKDVKLMGVKNYGIRVTNTMYYEIRGSFVNNVRAGEEGAPNHGGIVFDSVSASLVEDNIVYNVFPCIEVNFGSSGNVFGYNFIHSKDALIGIDTNHAAHNNFNLYEGNVAFNLMADGFYGSVSHDTMFRNWITGVLSDGAGGFAALGYTTAEKRMTRYYSWIGNVLGSVTDYPHGGGYSRGQPNMGSPFSDGTATPSSGDWWKDVDSSGATTYAGTLTTRTDDNFGTITLTAGTIVTGFQDHIHTYWTASHPSGARTRINSMTGATILDIELRDNGPLPAVSSTIEIWGGTNGFQEIDNDVENTALDKHNYLAPSGIPVGQSIGTDTLPNSLYRTAKPSWFGSKSWPLISADSPPTGDHTVALASLPAAHRYFYDNTSYLSSGATATVSGNTTATNVILP